MGVFRRSYREKGVLRTSRFWYVTDPATGEPRSLRVTDRRVAEMIAGDMLRQHELRVAGVETHHETRRARPLALLEEYEQHMARLNLAPRHVDGSAQRVRAFLSRVDSIADLTPSRIESLMVVVMDAQEAERRTKRPGAKRHRMGAKSQRGYLSALHTFFAWLLASKRWHEQPLLGVRRPKLKGQDAPERWALTREQLTAFIDPGHVPIWRAACYLLAATTGLRRGELRQLLEADLDLERGEVRARARMTKDAEDATLPLPPWTVEVLRLYLRACSPTFLPCQRGRPGRPRGARLFASVPQVPTLRRDLERAGISPVNEAGDVFDLHSLRVSFATLLAREGVGLQVVCDLMRHSDVRLTQAIYTRLVLHDRRAAVAALEPVRQPEPAAGTAGAAGDRKRKA